MELVGFYTDGKSLRFEGIKNVNGRAQAKKVLKNFLTYRKVPKFRILYVLLPGEIPRTVWNKLHDQNTRLADLHAASTMYTAHTMERYLASKIATKTFSKIPQPYKDLITSYYMRIYFMTKDGRLMEAIDGNVYKVPQV